MSSVAQRRALARFRSGLKRRGLTRFEVLGRASDKALVRNLTQQLANGGPERARLRAAISEAMGGEGTQRGGVLAAFRNSPLVGSGIDLRRPKFADRRIEL